MEVIHSLCLSLSVSQPLYLSLVFVFSVAVVKRMEDSGGDGGGLKEIG